MNELRTILNCVAMAGALASPGAVPALAQAPPEQVARRVAAVASLAADEYALGVRDGRIMQPAEYEESLAFLQNALADAATLPTPAAALVAARLDSMVAAANAVADPARLAGLVADLRAGLERALGVTLDPMPSGAPVLAVGETIWRRDCAQCHGPAGAADGPLAAGLTPPPADLTRPALAASTPLEFFRKITFGVANTAMEGFESRLSVDDRWAVALYAASLRYTDGERDAGRVALATCDACRQVLADYARALTLDDSALVALVQAKGASDTRAVRAFARTAGAREALGGDRRLRLARVLAATGARTAEAAALAPVDPAAAERAAVDAYLVFEGVEAEVRARRPDLASAVEAAFGRFRSAAGSGNAARVAATHAAVDSALDRVQLELAAGPDSPLLLFGQSLLIIVREGLEAILIIGALTAVLLRAGAAGRRREIGWGALAALAASGLGAVLLLEVFRITAAAQELMEGITMLVAAVVLFTVASWLVSKIEAARWRAFVGARMQAALASRGRLALAGLAFLVVFREGIETVLFYAALYATTRTPVESLGVTSGLLVGSVVLTLLYVGINRWGLRLPLRPIFGATGILLLVMAFSFAGQGVAELQAAGLLSMTRLDLPAFPALGIFPTVQTLAAQLALLTAFALAVALILLRKPGEAEARPPARP